MGAEKADGARLLLGGKVREVDRKEGYAGFSVLLIHHLVHEICCALDIII